MRTIVLALMLAAGCGSSPPPPAKPARCDEPAPGQPMTEAMCSCRGGNIQLSVGRAVELHCEPGEDELGAARIGERDGWCCKPR